MNSSIQDLARESVAFVREVYGDEFTPLHRPVFEGNKRQYLVDCINSNFVSSVGAKVTESEGKVAEFTGTKYAIAAVNGTTALHVAIQLAGVKPGDEVISQALTFIATDIPGCRETIINGKNGFLVSKKDHKSLSLAREKAIKDPDLLKKMGNVSRNLVESRFNVDKINEVLLREMQLSKI